MKACKTQCAQCPFRPGSAPGWLGGYGSGPEAAAGVGAIFRELWHGQPFFCHTRIDYTDPKWLDRALVRGPLCLGFLAARHRWKMPFRGDPAVLAAQTKVAQGALAIETFVGPNEWRAHHIQYDSRSTLGG